MSGPRFLTFCTLYSCGSLYLIPCAARERSLMMAEQDTLLYKYSRMLFDVVSRTVVFQFMPYPVSGPWPHGQC